MYGVGLKLLVAPTFFWMLLVPSTVFYVPLHGCGVEGVLDFVSKTEESWSKIGFNHGPPSSADSLERGHLIQTVL